MVINQTITKTDRVRAEVNDRWSEITYVADVQTADRDSSIIGENVPSVIHSETGNDYQSKK